MTVIRTFIFFNYFLFGPNCLQPLSVSGLVQWLDGGAGPDISAITISFANCIISSSASLLSALRFYSDPLKSNIMPTDYSAAPSEIIFPLTSSSSTLEPCVFRYENGPVKVKAPRRRGRPVGCMSLHSAPSTQADKFLKQGRYLSPMTSISRPKMTFTSSTWQVTMPAASAKKRASRFGNASWRIICITSEGERTNQIIIT